VQASAGGAIADVEKIAAMIQEVGCVVADSAAAIEEQATVWDKAVSIKST